MAANKNLYITLSLFSAFLCLVLGFSLIQNAIYSFSVLFTFLLGCSILKANNIYSHASILNAFLGLFITLTISILNYYVSVYVKGTPENPYILESDPELYHKLGMTLAQSEDWSKVIIFASNTNKGVSIDGLGINYIGYPIVLGFFYKYFYADLITGMVMTLFLGFLNTVLTGVVVQKLFNSASITSKAILLVALSSHIAAASTILLKDIFLLTAILLILLTVLDKWQLKSFIYLAVSALILFSFRGQLIAIIPLLFFIKYGLKTKIAVVLLVAYLSSQYLTEYSYLTTGNDLSSSSVQETIVNGTSESEWVIENTQTSTVNKLMSGYTQLPFARRLLMSPVAMVVQYATPFDFWVFKNDFPWYILLRNFNGIWFLFSGPLTIFSLWLAFKSNHVELRRICILGIGLYGLIAFSYSGVIPRYFTPFMPLLIVPAAWAWHQLNTRNVIKKSWKTFYAYYFTTGFLLVLFYLVAKML